MATNNQQTDPEAIVSASEIGVEPETLWQAADKLRGSVDAAEYKHVVLGLIFLKYISDAFESRRAALAQELAADGIEGEQAERLLESRDEYTAETVFWVPPEARWANIQNQAKQPNIAKLIDDAMYAIERDNQKLKGKLPRDYARRGIPPQRLGGLIDLIGSMSLRDPSPPAPLPEGEGRRQEVTGQCPRPLGEGGRRPGEGHVRRVSTDVLGRVYEYFLGKFAAAEGKLGGEFFTPSSVVRLLVEMIEPYEGRVYDPCCGSGGMFVQSVRFVDSHATHNNHIAGHKSRGQRDISIFGQESNPTTWRLAHMNLAIRGIEANLGEQAADSFVRDLHPDLKADYILANPPFNISDWSGQLLREDVRWKFGVPPTGNANYAWIQHFIHHLAPANGHGGGIAGFVMANGSLSSGGGGEGEIRQNLIEADLVDCVIAMPSQLFLTTGIPVCLWFIARNKSGQPSPRPSPSGRGSGPGDNPPSGRGSGPGDNPPSGRGSGPGDNPPSTSGRGAGGEGWRDRSGETLFIDARKMGTMVTRTLRVLSGREEYPPSPDSDIGQIARTYHAWRGAGPHPASSKDTLPSPFGRGGGGEGKPGVAPYRDIPGFCKSASLEDIKKHGYVLTPGRYVGAAEVEDDGEPFNEKIQRLTAELRECFAESDQLQARIKKNLEGIGYGL